MKPKYKIDDEILYLFTNQIGKISKIFDGTFHVKFDRGVLLFSDDDFKNDVIILLDKKKKLELL